MSEAATHYLTACRFLKNKDFSDSFKRGMYLGVQGPDIFFFAYGKEISPMMKFGFEVHHKCPANLFNRGYKYIRNTQSELIRGYFYGFLLHYVGDSNIHPYINMLAAKDKRQCTHGEAEKDIDIFVYEDYFKSPVKLWEVEKYFTTTREDIRDISSFWEFISQNTVIVEEDVMSAVKIMLAKTVSFTKADEADIAEAKIQEKPYGEGLLSSRFKINPSEKYLNLQKEPYETSTGTKNNTVYDILDETMEEFERLYEITEQNIKEHNRKFTYDFKLNFSGEVVAEII